MSFTAETKPRVCLSVASHHLDALDEIAERLERSRSWVAAQAFDLFLSPSADRDLPSVTPEPPLPAGVVGSAPCHCAAGAAACLGVSVAPSAGGGFFEGLAATLARAEEHTRRVAADEKAMREAANRRTHEYLTGKVST